MKNIQKGFIAPLLIAIIAMLVIGGGVYLYTQSKSSTPVTENQIVSTSTPQNTIPTSNQMANWKTYTNAQYGFSFQYPTSFGNLTTLKDNSLALGQNGNAQVVVYMPKVFLNNTTGQPKTFSDLMKDYDVKGYTKTNVTVDGIKSVGVSSSQIGSIVFVPLANNKILEIDGDLNNQTFSQILSSFKFTTINGVTTSSEFNEPLKDNGIVGWWTPSLAGDEKMAFYVDTKGVHHYDSFLHERPSYSGTWALVNNKLTVTYDASDMKLEVFTVVARYSNSIKLKDASGKESIFTFEGNYPVYPDFSFSVTQRDIGNKYPEYTVEISKDGTLAKKIVVAGSEAKPDQFAISPNHKYVAFQTADIGGTCVFVGKPVVVNLENFSFVQFDTSNINKSLQSKGVTDATQHVIGLQWLSNNTLQAIMKFGEKNNGVSDCIFPSGKDSFVDTINFTVGS